MGMRGRLNAEYAVFRGRIAQPSNLLVAVLAALLLFSPRSSIAQPLEDRLPACWGCHGENGRSERSDVPSLGAQPALYTLIQLVMFRDKLRVTEPMNEVMRGLQDAELRKAADLIAALPPPEPIADINAERMERARELAARNRCNFCHHSDYGGHNNVPRLAGQREDYLLKTLRSYKDNSRYGYEAQMSEVLYPLRDDDLVELAYFLARLK
jgi:cytochrome c553